MKKLLIAAFLLAAVPFSSFGWNKLGHDISAAIAQQNMTKKAKKNIAKYLEGHDIIYYASWMDYLGYVTKSGYSNEWFDHCVPVNKDFEYAEGDFPGDALMAVEKAIDRMKDGKYKSMDDSTVLLLIKHLVHFLPDMHCPAHVIYNYRPSNYWLKVDGEAILFHSVWDDMPSLGPHAWSVTEWCEQLDRCSKAEKAEMVSGTPREWVSDNARNCIVAYDIVRPDTELSDTERYEGNLLAEKQLLKGGYRLAYVLNLIFGSSVWKPVRRIRQSGTQSFHIRYKQITTSLLCATPLRHAPNKADIFCGFVFFGYLCTIIPRGGAVGSSLGS